jgi:hypothetical protein
MFEGVGWGALNWSVEACSQMVSRIMVYAWSDVSRGFAAEEKENNVKQNPVPLCVPLKLRLTRISTYLDSLSRIVSCSKYWLAGL